MNTSAIGRMLASYCLQGLVSLEDLDRPSDGWVRTEADRRTANSRALRIKQPPPCPPSTDHRNLAREWIAANKSEWEALLITTLNSEPSPPPNDPIHGL